MGAFITTDDLAPFATIDAVKAVEMIADAEATAILVAPCLATLNTAPPDETPEAAALRVAKIAAVKAILRGAILRWDDAGSGAIQQQSVGPFGQTIDTRNPRKGMFWPSEIDQLQGVCSSPNTGKAFTVDTAPTTATIHADTCSLVFGALYCSCGADIGYYPIYGI